MIGHLINQALMRGDLRIVETRHTQDDGTCIIEARLQARVGKDTWKTLGTPIAGVQMTKDDNEESPEAEVDNAD